MTVTISRGEAAALPTAEQAEKLLPLANADTLSLSCTDAGAAYRVLRCIMDYGYEHETPAAVHLICTDDAVFRAYSFQWNMWFAAQKNEHDA